LAEAGAEHVSQPYEGWIAADTFRGGVRAPIAGLQDFERNSSRWANLRTAQVLLGLLLAKQVVRQRLLHAPKYGNDIAEVDGIAAPARLPHRFRMQHEVRER
jgi:hypothetical protein